jgi:hypothetical protein
MRTISARLSRVTLSTGKRVLGSKLEGCFRLSSVRHSLLVTTANRAIIHHGHAGAGSISKRIIRDWAIRLAPPGIELTQLFQ